MSLHREVNEVGCIFYFDSADLSPQTIKLEELFAQEQAERLNNKSYFIKHENIVTLTVEDRECLDLPRIFPYKMRIDAKNILTNKSFRYQLNFMRPDGDIFINPQITGAFIRISSELSYTLNKAQYFIVNKIKEVNEKLEADTSNLDVMQYNFLNFAEIKSAAASINASIDKYIDESKVVVPDKLSIFPKFEQNGDILLNPIIIDTNGEVVSHNDDFVNVFNTNDRIRSVYSTAKGYYAINEQVKKGLEQIKKHYRVKSSDVNAFLQNPAIILDASAFTFNLDEYSDRVIEYGTYKYRTENGSPSGISWLPEEGTASKERADEDFNVTENNWEDIAKKVSEAQQQGKDYIDVIDERGNKKIPITVDLITKLEKCKKKSEQEASKELKKITDKTRDSKRSDNKVLIIRDNFESVDYSQQENIKDEITILTSEFLNSDIKLLKHQKQGLAWLIDCYKTHNGALLADDMGLGKTLQTLSFLGAFRKSFASDNKNSVLIVAPVSLISNWYDEYRKFIKPGVFKDIIILSSETITKYKKGSEFDLSSISEDNIVITTYETLRKQQLSFGKVDWSIIVLDEAQRIKNPTSLITLAVKAMKYQFGLCLTGTPIENTWVDLWSIMDFVQPGYKLGSLSSFKNEFVNPLKKNKGDREQIKILGQKLNDALDPLFMRRLKKELSIIGDLPNLPNKIIEKKEEIMPKEQFAAYENIVCEARNDIMTKQKALSIIARLRDISLYPDLRNIDERHITVESASKIFNSSARLKVTFRELVNICQLQEKVLIFSESKKMQRILRTVISKCFNINVPIPINGDMNSQLRQEIVNDFNSRIGFGVLILSPLAAGVGLNIASANHVIHLSRHWNPAKEDQATDRAYRIGQTKDVHVCIPLAIHPDLGSNGSFDEKLDMLLDYKRSLSEDALFPTGDTEEDGLDIFRKIIDNNSSNEVINNIYYSVDDIDSVTGAVFERIIEALYNKMNYVAVKTPDSNDNGADVIVKSVDKGENYLIQCKKTLNVDKHLGKDGVQEISAARSYYEKKEGCKFTCVVITNAKDFTDGAKELAKVNGVRLITRSELLAMINKNKIEKFYI